MSAGREDYPRLAWPFTIVLDGERVRLIHGDDVRYSLTLGPLAARAAEALQRCTGEEAIESLLTDATPEEQGMLRRLFERLSGERILVAGPVEAAHRPQQCSLQVEGSGAMAERLRREAEGDAGPPLAILCQDSLDYHSLLPFNRRMLRAGQAGWLWATTGPVSRALVSPVILPHAGPCLACLWSHFRRLSPASGLYDALVRHGEAGGAFPAAEASEHVLEAVAQIILWKAGELAHPRPSLALYRLHVVEAATFEVSVHRVLPDPTCADCGPAAAAFRPAE